MPEKWYKTVAKHSEKKSGKKTSAKDIKKYKKQALKDVPDDVEDKHAYATAVALRRAQGTGSKPHKKLESAEQAAAKIISEIAPEFISYSDAATYHVIAGFHEETNGMTEDHRWFGCINCPDDPFNYYRVVLKGQDAQQAVKSAIRSNKVQLEHTRPNTILQVISKRLMEAAKVRCPKCDSDDVLVGTSQMKNHCSACGHEWGEGEKPKRGKTESATTTAGVPDAFGPTKRPKESYNDNYNRPNQQRRRTNARMADGTSPAGSIDKPKRK